MSLITERIISPILDNDIRNNLRDSPIWKEAFKEEELFSELYNKYSEWYEYLIKFDGLKPVQFIKMNKYFLK